MSSDAYVYGFVFACVYTPVFCHLSVNVSFALCVRFLPLDPSPPGFPPSAIPPFPGSLSLSNCSSWLLFLLNAKLKGLLSITWLYAYFWESLSTTLLICPPALFLATVQRVRKKTTEFYFLSSLLSLALFLFYDLDLPSQKATAYCAFSEEMEDKSLFPNYFSSFIS